MKKSGKHITVKKWAVIFTSLFTIWFTLFMLVTTNFFPFSRCGSWEGEPFVSHCDAPYWEGWDALPIWIGVIAFIGAAISFVGLIRAHNARNLEKKR